MSTYLRILLLYFVTTIAALATSPSFEQGIESYQNNEYDSAQAQFTSAIEDDETAAAQHNLALTYLQLGSPALAIWHLERAQLLAPLNADYRFKLEAVRQQIGLFAGAPKWYTLASQSLPTNVWLIIASISIWLFLLLWMLPSITGIKPSIKIKSLRFLTLIALLLALPSAWLNLRMIEAGTVIANESVSLHAAPASAAPESGIARAGERARVIDTYKHFYEVETEGLATGWISKDVFRPFVD